MSIYLKPVIPNIISKVEAFLQVDEFVWDDCKNLLLDHEIAKFKPLLGRVTSEDFANFLEGEQINKLVNQKFNTQNKKNIYNNNTQALTKNGFMSS